MTETGIDCFLAICRHKTITRAAEELYITQSSLSMRLKNLETEVGGSLFFRKNGSREMTLTAAGETFYELAVQYEALLRKMKSVCRDEQTSLQVSCFNSLGTYLLPAVSGLFLQAAPQISLQMQDMEMTAATQSILRGETDLAFVAGHITDSRLRQFPAFSEPMVLILVADACPQTPVKLAALPPQEEVFVRWSQEFVTWHQKALGYAQPRLSVSIMAQLRQFLDREGRWAVVPVSVAKGLAAECNIRQCETDVPLPRREIACVVSAQEPAPALDVFLNCLRQVLDTYPEIEKRL